METGLTCRGKTLEIEKKAVGDCLQTERLTLTVATQELLQLEWHDPSRFAERLRASFPDQEWPPGEYDREAATYFLGRLRELGDEQACWHLWYAVCRDDRDTGRLVAAGGFFGPPEMGRVEIGLSVITSVRGRGIGTELLAALIDFAFCDERVEEVLAHTTPENRASQGLLCKLDFTRQEMGTESDVLTYRLTRAMYAARRDA